VNEYRIVVHHYYSGVGLTDSGMIRKLNSIGKLTLKVPEAGVVECQFVNDDLSSLNELSR